MKVVAFEQWHAQRPSAQLAQAGLAATRYAHDDKEGVFGPYVHLVALSQKGKKRCISMHFIAAYFKQSEKTKWENSG
jgi:hypothetical protein